MPHSRYLPEQPSVAIIPGLTGNQKPASVYSVAGFFNALFYFVLNQR